MKFYPGYVKNIYRVLHRYLYTHKVILTCYLPTRTSVSKIKNNVDMNAFPLYRLIQVMFIGKIKRAKKVMLMLSMFIFMQWLLLCLMWLTSFNYFIGIMCLKILTCIIGIMYYFSNELDLYLCCALLA